jgi:hypothetical protein
MKKIVLKFIKGHELWIKGDVACFDEEEAGKIIASGVANSMGQMEVDAMCQGQTIKSGDAWKARVPGELRNKKTFICPICGQHFKNQTEKDKHKVEAHGIK